MTTFLLMTLACGWVGAEPSEAQEKAWREEIVKIAAAKARSVQILAGETAAESTLRSEPLLSWSNPTVGNVYGDVYLWSYRGRPVAIGSVYRWYHPVSEPPTLEITSVTELELKGREGKNSIWRARQPGVSFKPLAEAPAAAETPAARLRQMRALAGRFAATLTDDRDTADVQRKLRLLTQPVHRYNSEQEEILDGAVFGFVEGTDPELWLLIEAGKDKAWRYALARMNSSGMAISLDDKVVQRLDKAEDAWKNDDRTYRLFKFAEP